MAHGSNGSVVTAFAEQLSEAFHELHIQTTPKECEELAIFLTRAMGGESRDYHRPEHSLQVAQDLPPIPKLAGLFHDVVYVQVDPSWRSSLSEVLSPFHLESEYRLNVAKALEHTTEKWFKIAAIIFGIETQEELTIQQGLNEFLSTIVMIRKLGKRLSKKDLIKAIACIESTIPFRKKDERGRTPEDLLAERLRLAKLELASDTLTDSEILEITQDCRLLIEKDLASFNSDTTAEYLSDTWRVIYENNPSIRNTYFSIIEYRKALLNAYQFAQGLDPSSLFWIHPNVKNKSKDYLTTRASINLKISIEYLRINLMSIVFLEAVAMQTGGDGPVEYFLGPKKRSREHQAFSIESELEIPPFESDVPFRQEVFQLLSNGRKLRSKFDRKNSPLAAYFYSTIPEKDFQSLWNLSLEFIERKIVPEKFLLQFPILFSAPVIHALSRIALFRSFRLIVLFDYLKKASDC